MSKNKEATNKIQEIEVSHAAISAKLEQQKLQLTETMDKLSKEEANHVATKNLLEQEKTDLGHLKEQFDLEKQNHDADLALLDQERMYLWIIKNFHKGKLYDDLNRSILQNFADVCQKMYIC